MFCEKQLSDARTINELNATLKLLTAHLDEYDRNLNGISAQNLIEKFKKVRNDNIESEKNDINAMNFSDSSNYQIIPINTFEEAEEYGEYTNPNSQWCLTYMEDMFDSYTSNGVNQMYFCLRNGFEQVPCRVGENTPLDEYGLSMLCVIVNENGELAYCTTRWNHENGGNDNAMNAKEISQVVGVNFYQVFKPNTKWQELLSDVKEKLKQGLPLDDIFDDVNVVNDVYIVLLSNKINIINKKRQFISEQWFDGIGNFKDGVSKVWIDDKYNFINTNGDFISKQWFDYIHNYDYDGFAKVKLDDKYNFINTNGELLSKQWFDDAMDYGKDLISVTIDGRQLKMNRKGKIFRITENKQFKAHKKSLKLSETVLENIIKESITKVLLKKYN